jgi:hypothetical protein
LVLFFLGYQHLIRALSVRRYALPQRGSAPASLQPNIAIADTAAPIEIDAVGVVKIPPVTDLTVVLRECGCCKCGNPWRDEAIAPPVERKPWDQKETLGSKNGREDNQPRR